MYMYMCVCVLISGDRRIGHINYLITKRKLICVKTS